MLDDFASYYFSVFTFIIYTEKLTNTTSFGNIKKGCSPRKLTNIPWKCWDLKTYFPFEMVPLQVSNEMDPGCLGYIGDDTIILPSYVGIIISHYKGVPIKQPVSCPGANTWCRHSEAKHHEASSEFAGGWNNKSRGSQKFGWRIGDPWWVPWGVPWWYGMIYLKQVGHLKVDLI